MSVRDDYSPASEPGGGRALTKYYAIDAHEHAAAINTLITDVAGKQSSDSDLSTIAGLTATTDNVIQSVSSAWASRTPAQLKTTLALAKGDVGLGNVDNTSNATERAASAALTNKDLTSGTNTFPTFNQNTTGSAATLTTARTINGVSFNGSANIVIVPRIGTTASSATPSIDCALFDQYNITALAANITGITVSNTYDGCKLAIRFTGTATRTIVHGSNFQSSGVATLLAATSGTNTHLAFYVYDGVKAKFVCMAVDATGY